MTMDNKMTFIEGTAVGAVAGVIATLLLAPKSGKKTRDDIKAHLLEIKDKLVAQLETLEAFTQDRYDEIVKTLIAEYEAAQKIPADEAREIEADLRDGYEAIRQTVCEHACGRHAAAKTKPTRAKTAKPAKPKA
jgi:gas vesicle protein